MNHNLFPTIRMLPYRLLALGLLVAYAFSCSRNTVVILLNTSSRSISEVLLTGRGCSIPMGDLPAGARRTVPLDLPAGEHGYVTVSFLAAGGLHSSQHTVYFEARGYELTITIRPDLSCQANVTVAYSD